MSEEQLAALEEDQTVTLDENQETDDLTPNEESAPSTENLADEPKETPEWAQKKINKVVGQKHGEARRANKAERRVLELEQQLQTQNPVKSDGAPKEEDFDFDPVAHNAALIKYEVGKAKEEFRQEQVQLNVQQERQGIMNDWNTKIAKLKKEDIQETLGRIPDLPEETLLALMQLDNGPTVGLYLADHLDIADDLSRLTPAQAGVKMGQISARLSNANPSNKPSAAPDPVTPLKPGGTVSGERGPAKARYE